MSRATLTRLTVLLGLILLLAPVPARANHIDSAGTWEHHFKRLATEKSEVYVYKIIADVNTPERGSYVWDAANAWQSARARVALVVAYGGTVETGDCVMPTADETINVCIYNWGPHAPWDITHSDNYAYDSMTEIEGGVSGAHFLHGLFKLNTYYLDTEAELRSGICHVMGHGFGLQQQKDEAGHPTSCMTHIFSAATQWPDAHDLAEVRLQFQHTH